MSELYDRACVCVCVCIVAKGRRGIQTYMYMYTRLVCSLAKKSLEGPSNLALFR